MADPTTRGSQPQLVITRIADRLPTSRCSSCGHRNGRRGVDAYELGGEIVVLDWMCFAQGLVAAMDATGRDFRVVETPDLIASREVAG